MQLVKPGLPANSSKFQPVIREHHYDTPANYAANARSGKKSKKESTSDSPKAKRAGVGVGVGVNQKGLSSKKKSSKQNTKSANTTNQSTSLQVGGASKDPRGQFNLRSLLKKKKASKRDSVDEFESNHGNNGGKMADYRSMYVNVKVDSLHRMKKSVSCDDLLNSGNYSEDTPSAVPGPRMHSSSQTPPVQRRGYSCDDDDKLLETGDGASPSAASLVYQNLQDIKNRGESSHSHPATPSFAPEEGSPQRTLVTPDHPHLYTNVVIMSEEEASPLVKKGTTYTEVEICQNSPPRDDQQTSSTPPGGRRIVGSNNEMPAFLQKALQKKSSPKVSPRASPKVTVKSKKDRSLSLVQSSDQPGKKESRHRSQSEALLDPADGRGSAAVMDFEEEAKQKLAPSSQYVKLDFAVMEAVAELKKGHNDVRNFDELLERHDIREMEMEGKRR